MKARRLTIRPARSVGLVVPYHHWTMPGDHVGFVVMYALMFFFANFGPNNTTFIVPAEIFPAGLRSTCHGISAVAGKAGVIIVVFRFLYAAHNQDKAKADHGYPAGIGVRNSLFVLAACNLVGIVFTFLVPESNGKSLEELSGEDKDHEQIASQVTYTCDWIGQENLVSWLSGNPVRWLYWYDLCLQQNMKLMVVFDSP